MIRIDAIWLATEPMDMRAGTETALARVIAVLPGRLRLLYSDSPPLRWNVSPARPALENLTQPKQRIASEPS
ncbi:transposase [Pseudomonas fluorescens]|uniref:Transposase n=1 Tax=Pseudomonas fluorescens TaxID=294 RepID=A0A3S5E9Q0_PSEFL|nr:transposase [Pseudomonas fluorescens]